MTNQSDWAHKKGEPQKPRPRITPTLVCLALCVFGMYQWHYALVNNNEYALLGCAATANMAAMFFYAAFKEGDE